MSSMVHQPAADATRNVAPLAVRRRPSAMHAGTPQPQRNDEFPVLIRLADLEKAKLAKSQPLNIPTATAVEEPSSQVPADRKPPVAAPHFAKDEEEAELSSRERADSRRRRRQAEPEANKNWQALAMQWGTVLGVVVAVSIAFQAMHNASKKNDTVKDKETVQETAPAVLEHTFDTSPNNHTALLPPRETSSVLIRRDKVENAVVTPPPPVVPLPTSEPEKTEPTDAKPEVPLPPLEQPNQSFEPPRNSSLSMPVEPPRDPAPRMEIPNVPPNTNNRLEVASPYPTTSTTNFRYRPSNQLTSDSNGLNGRNGSEGTRYASQSDSERSLREEGVRAARIKGIQTLPTREHR